jgi:hypothetical protein
VGNGEGASSPDNGSDRIDVKPLKAEPWECLRSGINPQVIGSVGYLLKGCENL